MANQSTKNRSISRLLAVQTLFAVEAGRKRYKDVIEHIRSRSLSELLDNTLDQEIEYDSKHLETLVKEAVNSQVKLDQNINAILKEGWPLKNIDPLLRAIFRASGAEMLAGKTPIKVTINEFIEVSKAFDDRKETTSFVNAVLDQLSKELMPPN